MFGDFEFKPAYLEGMKAPTLSDNPSVWKERFNLMGISGAGHGDDQIDQKKSLHLH